MIREISEDTQRRVQEINPRYEDNISKKMADIVGVNPPHYALVMPEMYFHYSLVFLYGNKSLRFQLFAEKIKQKEAMNTEDKNCNKTKKKGK